MSCGITCALLRLFWGCAQVDNVRRSQQGLNLRTVLTLTFHTAGGRPIRHRGGDAIVHSAMSEALKSRPERVAKLTPPHPASLKRTMAVPKIFDCPVLRSSATRAGKNRPGLSEVGQSFTTPAYLPVPFSMQDFTVAQPVSGRRIGQHAGQRRHKVGTILAADRVAGIDPARQPAQRCTREREDTVVERAILANTM